MKKFVVNTAQFTDNYVEMMVNLLRMAGYIVDTRYYLNEMADGDIAIYIKDDEDSEKREAIFERIRFFDLF